MEKRRNGQQQTLGCALHLPNYKSYPYRSNRVYGRLMFHQRLTEIPSLARTSSTVSLMAEVTAIVNSRPLLPVPSDPEMPEILTPATLLTHKSRALKSIPGSFSSTELYSKQWRQVQHLANMFWTRWGKEYLPTLQPRRKWQGETRNLEEGDLVLLHCKESPRNYWPLARITKAYVSTDGKVRKVDLVTAKDGSTKSYTRPVTEVILLRRERDFEKMTTPLG